MTRYRELRRRGSLASGQVPISGRVDANRALANELLRTAKMADRILVRWVRGTHAPSAAIEGRNHGAGSVGCTAGRCNGRADRGGRIGDEEGVYLRLPSRPAA